LQKKINEIYTIRLNAVDRDGNTRYEYLRQQVKDAARPRYYRDVMVTKKKPKEIKIRRRKLVNARAIQIKRRLYLKILLHQYP
jgi:hypothetical protein